MEKVKYILTKEDLDNYYIRAKIAGQEVGYAWFTLSRHRAYLHFIGVNENFRNLHIGSNLLNCVENFCCKEGAHSIEGDFYPKGISKEHCLSFYKKNGYSYTVDDYDHILTKYFARTTPSVSSVNYTDCRTRQ